MERIRRNERLAAMTHILQDAPNQIVTLSRFCEQFGTAKSTMSEDIDILREVFDRYAIGMLETVAGASGGVRYRPALTGKPARKAVTLLSERLSAPGRVLPGGFLYLTDILCAPSAMEQMARILAAQFYDTNPDFILTVETQGIPLAMMAARIMNLPLVIARNDIRMYEGPAVHINYMASSGGIKIMALSRRSVREGQRALIIDDFVKGGGTLRGMVELMREFSVSVVGTGILLATREPTKRQIERMRALMVMDDVDGERLSARVRPSEWVGGEE